MEFLKYLGFILMIIDHATVLYFPDFIWGRIVGRLSTPIFFYLLAIGYRRSRSQKRYLFRLLIWGLVAEIIIYLLGLKLPLNILFTLAWCLIALVSIHQSPKSKKLIVAIGFTVAASIIGLDYGWYAVLCTIAFTLYNPKSNYWWFLWVVIHCASIFFVQPIQFFALPTPFLISAFEGQKQDLPRLGQIWYFLYSLQWILLCTLPPLLNSL